MNDWSGNYWGVGVLRPGSRCPLLSLKTGCWGPCLRSRGWFRDLVLAGGGERGSGVTQTSQL